MHDNMRSSAKNASIKSALLHDDRGLDVRVRDGRALTALEPARTAVRVTPRERLASGLLETQRAAPVHVGAAGAADVIADVVHTDLERAARRWRIGQHRHRRHACLEHCVAEEILEVTCTSVLVDPRERAAPGHVDTLGAAVARLRCLRRANVVADKVDSDLKATARVPTHTVRGCRSRTLVHDCSPLGTLEPARAAVVRRERVRAASRLIVARCVAVFDLGLLGAADVVADKVDALFDHGARAQLAGVQHD